MTDLLRAISRSTSVREMFTSRTPNRLCFEGLGWHPTVEQEGSLGMGLITPKMRVPSAAVKVRARA